MPHIRVLSKGARITAGALCLLFLLHTLYWLGHDLVTLGPGTVWDLWTGGASAGFGGAPMAAYPVTTPYELGLALLQGAAVGTAYAGRRPAGGLLAVATTLTLSLRVQAVVSTGSHTSTDLWFVGGGGIDESTLTAVFLSTGALVQSLGSGSGASLEMLFTGHGVLRAMLGMAPGWAWLTFLPLCAVGTILAATRRVSARGFALGTALALLPVAFLALIGSLRTGTLFELGDVAPGGALLGRVQMLVELVGSVVVLVLMGRRGGAGSAGNAGGSGIRGSWPRTCSGCAGAVRAGAHGRTRVRAGRRADAGRSGVPGASGASGTPWLSSAGRVPSTRRISATTGRLRPAARGPTPLTWASAGSRTAVSAGS